MYFIKTDYKKVLTTNMLRQKVRAQTLDLFDQDVKNSLIFRAPECHSTNKNQTLTQFQVSMSRSTAYPLSNFQPVKSSLSESILYTRLVSLCTDE